MNLDFRFPKLCPINHYSRKNVGYLISIAENCEVLYDTDDDNRPKENWHLPQFFCSNELGSGEKFINVYQHFSNANIWPRGFPLDEIRKPPPLFRKTSETATVGIWQGLADSDPDVDAIYRLTNGIEVKFEDGLPVFLRKGSYCPINSQNTFWRKELFPLMYLPAKVSFRFTDILRGYIAQVISWNHGYQVGFTQATVDQERNDHDLMIDFQQEIECYTQIKQVVDLLERITLSKSVLDDLILCYEALSKAQIVPKEELPLVRAWVEDVGLAEKQGASL